MSGRGCQLLVSPCNVSPSMSMAVGHPASPQRANFGPCVGTDRMKKRVNGSFASESQNGSHVVLPSLCLRRQVLTNGKDGNVLGPQVPAHQGPTVAVPRSSKGTKFKNIESSRSCPGFGLQKSLSGWSPSPTARSGIDN